MKAIFQAGAAMLVASAILQASLGPVCQSQTAPLPREDVAAEQKKATNESTKPKWEPGKITSLQEMLVVQGPAYLLAAPAVQEELGLSEEQREKLARLEQGIKRSQREAIEGIENPPAKLGEAMAPVVLTLRLEKWQALDQILTKAQKRRLLEVALQTEGPLAVLWPEIQVELRLTPGQQAMLAEVEEQARSGLKTYRMSIQAAYNGPDPTNPMPPRNAEEAQERFEGMTADLDRFHEAFLSHRERTAEPIARILTRRQRERFNRMMGEPFDVSDLQRPGGGNWQPEDAKRYWEQREAGKAKATKDPAEAGKQNSP